MTWSYIWQGRTIYFLYWNIHNIILCLEIFDGLHTIRIELGEYLGCEAQKSRLIMNISGKYREKFWIREYYWGSRRVDTLEFDNHFFCPYKIFAKAVMRQFGVCWHRLDGFQRDHFRGGQGEKNERPGWETGDDGRWDVASNASHLRRHIRLSRTAVPGSGEKKILKKRTYGKMIIINLNTHLITKYYKKTYKK